MRAIHKRLTREDRFARKYYCNSYRFLPKMKRMNRKKFRRKIKEVIVSDLQLLGSRQDAQSPQELELQEVEDDDSLPF